MEKEYAVEACPGCGKPFWYKWPFKLPLKIKEFCPQCLIGMIKPPTIRDSIGGSFLTIDEASKSWVIDRNHIHLSLTRNLPIEIVGDQTVGQLSFHYEHPSQRRFRHHVRRIGENELNQILKDFDIKE